GVLLKNSIMAWDALIQDDEDVMAGEVEDFKNTGGGAILEVSVPGIQLDTASIRRVSQRAGVRVVVSTGFYTWDSWPERFLNLSVRAYRDHMLSEIRYGAQETDIRPGCIKIAVEDLNQMEENALRAAAQAACETGLPLTVHPCSKRGADQLLLIKILREEGLDPGRVVFAHTSVEDRPASFRELIEHPELYQVTTELARRIMDEGANCSFEFCNPLGFEMMGRYRVGDFGRMSGLCQLIRAGYADRIVLGNDVCGRTMLRRGGALGYTRLTTFVLPALRQAGEIPERAVRQIMTDNPARILAY
ncbi:MAG: phosphotriesterase, partial [Peptococcaceae bacterium]|nr:phosphotriesterase [Peptococcaceae bacterium]